MALVPRKLWFIDGAETVKIDQEDILKRSEPMILLGEAGMGKTELTKWLGEHDGYTRCTARELINRANPQDVFGKPEVLVIDALDEVTARGEGDAVDRVLQKLGGLGYPKFIPSCRVADWRSATGTSAVNEQYPNTVIELNLEPLDEEAAIAILSDRLGADRAREVVAHFKSKDVAELLGNPQTLRMIERVAEVDSLPDNIGALFEQFVELAWAEHNNQKPSTSLQSLGKEAVLDALGAAFGAQILTGKEALSRKPRHIAEAEGDLSLGDVSSLDGASILSEVLDSRLIQAVGPDRFSYPHRRIGEFLGARWLAKCADTRRKRVRLLGLFHALGLVPASLRGVHAWLARHNAKLAPEVIAADPMGLIEYGDASNLSISQARALIESLKSLAERNPYFRDWGPYSLGGIAKEELFDDVRVLITAPETPFGLRLLVLEGLRGSILGPRLITDLRELVLDKCAAYAIRKAAGDALIALQPGDSWREIAQGLSEDADENSVRLALELGADLKFNSYSNNLLAELVVAQSQFDEHTIGPLFLFGRDLPQDRIEGFLDALARIVPKLEAMPDTFGANDLADLTYTLVVRCLQAGPVDAKRAWSWLRPFSSYHGYSRDSKDKLTEIFKANQDFRRAVQRQALGDNDVGKTTWERAWRMNDLSAGLTPTAADVIELIIDLGAPDEPSEEDIQKWKDTVQLVRHAGEDGAAVREAALRFAEKTDGLIEWLDQLAIPQVPSWQVEHERRAQEREAEKQSRWKEHRKSFGKRIDAIRGGEFGAVVNPAKAYLKLFHDMGDDLPAHERVEEWLGPELAEAAHIGFEAFLKLENPKPNASEIAESYASGRRWDAGFIIIAAIAERVRQSIGFDDLPDERILAGYYEQSGGYFEDHAGLQGIREALQQELAKRGILECAIRGWIEPQLKLRKDHIDGFYSLLREDGSAELATRLAVEWLENYPDMAAAPEAELIDRLINSGRFLELKAITAHRLTMGELGDERRRNWDAIALLVDFEAARTRLENGGGVEPELLWHLRARLGGRWNGTPKVSLSAEQLTWIIQTFRTKWEAVSHPTGASSGDTNPWDASDYIQGLIRRLGDVVTDGAVALLDRLKSAPGDGYTGLLKLVSVEQAQNRVEQEYVHPTVDQIAAVTRDDAPTTAADLQAVMIEELRQAQAKIMADDIDTWRDFYDALGKPHDEERCRDELIGLLRQETHGIELAPEAHVAADKEVDIGCTVGQLRVPIEVKGQWHNDLWHAADTQLSRLYSSDWRAERRGIYVVLWFGENGKPLRSPPKGIARPTTPEDLRQSLIANSKVAREGLVEIVVLDLSRQ